ncbi:MAG: ArnT family glycosyltransferase, partial [Hylemonella sp.]
MRSSGIHNKRFDKSPVWQVLLLLLLALCVYVYGLGGQYVPTIGDEMVYVHIARMTAESGQWLPLASELPGTRNTKPPLLFWQAMVAGDWGKHWSPAFLRAPSVLYTFLLSAAIAACTHRITRRWTDAVLAGCLFLAFFSTYRFGRPYLTSAPETFWLSLPMLALLWLRGREPLLTS